MSVKANQPIRIQGVTIRPKWGWTDDYLRDTREHMSRQSRRSPLGADERRHEEEKLRRYAEFLAQSRGITIKEAEALAREKIAHQASAANP